MTDDKIRQTSAEHYPQWHHDRVAPQVFRLICEYLPWRCRASTLAGTEESRLDNLSFLIAIPKSQFEEVRSRQLLPTGAC